MEASIELNELRDAAQRVITGQVDRLAMLRDPSLVAGVNRDLWSTVATLGWPALAVPELRGGLGQPFTALAVLYTELGKGLVGIGFADAFIGLDVLSRDGAAPTAAAVLEAGIAGDAVVMLAGTEVERLSALRRGESIVLEGDGPLLLGAELATHLLLPFRLAGETMLALIALPRAGVSLQARRTWDVTRGQVHVPSLRGVSVSPGDIVLRGPAADEAIARAGAHMDLALACDAVGGSEQVFAETLAYMQTRQQFKRVIASFQALKHRCADLKTSMEAARALAEASCHSFAAGRGHWRAAASAARLYAGAVYRQVSEDAIQLHGGIGFTWEQSCHLFLKRARLNEELNGTIEQRKDSAATDMLRTAQLRGGSLLTQQTQFGSPTTSRRSPLE
jgi:alkylation response protein AidB-like acyl-CoA dehydrogenase